MADQTLMDKSLRSVFVGNIPYEATEEKLKDIFSEVGPVLSFKLVYDRETGKPKGYGFCEYKDQETALSAMRNLNAYEIGGRTLRVDNACTEKSRMEMQSLLQGPVVENPYGEAVNADKAPEAISKAVASLPPEQMFELMKQMKLCVQNTPNEARQMLLQNPQLAYALLQAQVVMRIVDPHIAMTMLHKTNPMPGPLVLAENSVAPAPVPVPAPVQEPQWVPPPRPPNPVPPPAFVSQDVDHRQMMEGRMTRMPEPNPPPAAAAPAPIRPPPLPIPPVVPAEQFTPPDQHFPRDPRVGNQPLFPAARDPRSGTAPHPGPVQRAPAPIPPNLGPRLASNAGASDQQKAALIMQVLKLSDEQIAMLPPEQRQSILVLKEQIAKSTQI